MKDGGYLVPNAVAEELAVNAGRSMNSTVYRILWADRRTWEQRLADAIETRSIRNRLRRGWAETRRRLDNARLALMGRWEASDDYGG